MRFFPAIILALAVTLTGCASGVKHKDMEASIPALKPDAGRIYFYRTSSMFGAAIQPPVSLDGAIVGDSKPGGFFFVDAKTGNHEVMCATEVEKKLTFTLDKGEVKYVRTSVGLGLLMGRVIPELVSKEEAMKDLPGSSYTGSLAAAK